MYRGQFHFGPPSGLSDIKNSVTDVVMAKL